MTGPSWQGGAPGTRWSVAVSLLVAAAMATIAFITVQHAGCDDPGHYEPRGASYELVGGCIEAQDLPVGPDTVPAPAEPPTEAPFPVRP